MSYREYLRTVRKNWWVVLLTLILAAGAASALTLATEKKYATSLTFFVKTPSDQLSTAAQGDAFGQKRVNSYIQLVKTDRVLKPVLASTKLDMSSDALANEITASGDVNTVLLTVIVTDPSISRSGQIASAVSTQFVAAVASLESTGAGGDTSVRLELVSGPKPNLTPVSPLPLVNLGVALLIGFIAGIALAVLREAVDTTLRSAQSVEQITGDPVIGVILYDDGATKQPLILDGDARSIRSEAFRQLRTNLDFVDVDHPARVVVVTSSVPNEGKSSTATNLAVIFAEAGKRVLLIEGDLRRPRVAEYLGLEGSVGLTNVLAGQVKLADVLQPWGRGGLTVLPSGSVPPNPSELLGSHAMVDMLEQLTQRFDIILIDSPPLLPVTDAAVLAAHSDGAIIVVRHGKTKRQQLLLAVASLKRVDSRILGAVLNMAPAKGVGSQGYGYSYGYGDTYESDNNTREKLDVENAQAAVRNSASQQLSVLNGHNAHRRSPTGADI